MKTIADICIVPIGVGVSLGKYIAAACEELEASGLQTAVHQGIAAFGPGSVAIGQFYGAALLSAILDNNIVADFASRALYDLDLGVLHLFALAQITGYAAGGCLTHIGSAQSVVA